MLAASDVVITASGTATVQAALHGKPMVVVHACRHSRTGSGNRSSSSTYAMVNLVAGRRIVPELIQTDFTAERVAHEAIALLTDADRHARTRDALRDVCQRLGTPGASGRAADATRSGRTGALRRAFCIGSGSKMIMAMQSAKCRVQKVDRRRRLGLVSVLWLHSALRPSHPCQRPFSCLPTSPLLPSQSPSCTAASLT